MAKPEQQHEEAMDEVADNQNIPATTSNNEVPSLSGKPLDDPKTNNNDGVKKDVYDLNLNCHKKFPVLFGMSKNYPKKKNNGVNIYCSDIYQNKALDNGVNFVPVSPPKPPSKLYFTSIRDTDDYPRCYLNDGKSNDMVKRCLHFGMPHYQLIHKEKIKTPKHFTVLDTAKAPKKKSSGKRQEKYKNMVKQTGDLAANFRKDICHGYVLEKYRCRHTVTILNTRRHV